MASTRKKTVNAINLVPIVPTTQKREIGKAAVSTKTRRHHPIQNETATKKTWKGCHGYAQWGRGDRWYPCQVLQEREEETAKLTVRWKDGCGSISFDVPLTKFRPSSSSSSPLPRGKGQFGKSGRWYPCTVLNENDQTVDVEWDQDGTTTFHLPLTKFRPEGDEVSQRRQQQVNPFKKESVEYSMSRTPHFQRHNLARSTRKRKRSHRPNNGSMGDSVCWIPKNRDEWLDCSDELAALCAEASLRSALRLVSHPPAKKKKNEKDTAKFIDPVVIPKSYIEQRLDIDDPLDGFQLRHAQGGWLQGFVLWTTFTSWTRYFKWDSLHPKSGMTRRRGGSSRTMGRPSGSIDYGGNLAAELERQSRAGDPHGSGVIWPSIAEISLIGGFGCGELLLRTAMERIQRDDKGYKYIVLQATESSKGFYERLGFQRVGAICKYGKDSNTIVGYRHWADADETNLHELHGGPSHMMAKKICPTSNNIMSSLSSSSLLSMNTVDRKPTILPVSKQHAFARPPLGFIPAKEWIEKGIVPNKHLKSENV